MTSWVAHVFCLDRHGEELIAIIFRVALHIAFSWTGRWGFHRELIDLGEFISQVWVQHWPAITFSASCDFSFSLEGISLPRGCKASVCNRLFLHSEGGKSIKTGKAGIPFGLRSIFLFRVEEKHLVPLLEGCKVHHDGNAQWIFCCAGRGEVDHGVSKA